MTVRYLNSETKKGMHASVKAIHLLVRGLLLDSSNSLSLFLRITQARGIHHRPKHLLVGTERALALHGSGILLSELLVDLCAARWLVAV